MLPVFELCVHEIRLHVSMRVWLLWLNAMFVTLTHAGV